MDYSNTLKRGKRNDPVVKHLQFTIVAANLSVQVYTHVDISKRRCVERYTVSEKFFNPNPGGYGNRHYHAARSHT
jgi:hypothetical protein